MNDCPRILVVDDDPAKLKGLICTLVASGFDVITARTGDEAFRLTQEVHPAIVLLDGGSPDIDRSAFYQQLKAAPETANASVVFTLAVKASGGEQASELGDDADGYIAWPVSPQALLAQVKTLLRLKRAEAALRESREAADALLKTERALRTSQMFLQSVLDSLSANIAILDETGTIVAVNASWRRFADENGMTWPDYGLGRNYLHVLESARGRESKGAREMARAIRQIIEGTRESITVEYPCHSPTEKRWFTMTTTHFQGDGGVRVVLAHQNITQQKMVERRLKRATRQAERARRQEEEKRREADRRRQIAESLGEVLNALNSNRPVNDVLSLIADQARRLFDCQAVSVYQLISKKPTQNGGEDEVPLLELAAGAETIVDRTFLRDLLASRQPMFTYSAVQAVENSPPGSGAEPQSMIGDGFTCSCNSTLGVPIVSNDEPIGALLLYFAHERRFNQEDLELAAVFGNQVALVVENARLREEARESARVSERARLARELHDSVTQSLYSLTLLAEGQRRLAQLGRLDDAVQALGELGEIAQQALKEMRLLVYELRPPALASQGLLGALQHRLNTVERRAGVEARLEASPDIHLSRQMEEELYWISQEALNNVVKHSGAKSVVIRLRQQEGEVEMTISDDGRGFDADSVTGQAGMGLQIMQERAAKLAGALSIHSQAGRGTTVQVTVSAR